MYHFSQHTYVFLLLGLRLNLQIFLAGKVGCYFFNEKFYVAIHCFFYALFTVMYSKGKSISLINQMHSP